MTILCQFIEVLNLYSAEGRACFLQTYSKGEKELCNFIKSIYFREVLENTRKFIGGKELDIYLPELKLAFEYNGEYWHKIHEEKEPGYHKNKQKACEENGVKLIEIWENDWKKNNQQIKDLISKHLQI